MYQALLKWTRHGCGHINTPDCFSLFCLVYIYLASFYRLRTTHWRRVFSSIFVFMDYLINRPIVCRFDWMNGIYITCVKIDMCILYLYVYYMFVILVRSMCFYAYEKYQQQYTVVVHITLKHYNFLPKSCFHDTLVYWYPNHALIFCKHYAHVRPFYWYPAIMCGVNGSSTGDNSLYIKNVQSWLTTLFKWTILLCLFHIMQL